MIEIDQYLKDRMETERQIDQLNRALNDDWGGFKLEDWLRDRIMESDLPNAGIYGRGGSLANIEISQIVPTPTRYRPDLPVGFEVFARQILWWKDEEPSYPIVVLLDQQGKVIGVGENEDLEVQHD